MTRLAGALFVWVDGMQVKARHWEMLPPLRQAVTTIQSLEHRYLSICRLFAANSDALS
jgi:hypothetical protein